MKGPKEFPRDFPSQGESRTGRTIPGIATAREPIFPGYPPTADPGCLGPVDVHLNRMTPPCPTAAWIDDFFALARALAWGMGRPAGFRR